eukprot:scaffold1938_cov399-Prasinococcus_capsulatus_cf.AAC.6
MRRVGVPEPEHAGRLLRRTVSPCEGKSANSVFHFRARGDGGRSISLLQLLQDLLRVGANNREEGVVEDYRHVIDNHHHNVPYPVPITGDGSWSVCAPTTALQVYPSSHSPYPRIHHHLWMDWLYGVASTSMISAALDRELTHRHFKRRLPRSARGPTPHEPHPKQSPPGMGHPHLSASEAAHAWLTDEEKDEGLCNN